MGIGVDREKVAQEKEIKETEPWIIHKEKQEIEAREAIAREVQEATGDKTTSEHTTPAIDQAIFKGKTSGFKYPIEAPKIKKTEGVLGWLRKQIRLRRGKIETTGSDVFKDLKKENFQQRVGDEYEIVEK